MNAVPTHLLLTAAAWVGLCASIAVMTLRRRPRQAEHGLVLGGLALLALAPCTFVLLHAVDDSPSMFSSAVQLAAAVLLLLAAARARHARLNPDGGSSTAGYPEKSALLAATALLVVTAVYLARTWGAPTETLVPAFLGTLVLLIAIMVVGHVVLALFHAPFAELDAPGDERDREVTLRSLRNSHYVLAAGFWSMPLVLLAPLATGDRLHLWLAMLVAAEVVYYASVAAYYRFGTG